MVIEGGDPDPFEMVFRDFFERDVAENPAEGIEIVKREKDFVILIRNHDQQFMPGAFSGLENEFFRHVGIRTGTDVFAVPEDFAGDAETVDAQLDQSSRIYFAAVKTDAAFAEPRGRHIKTARHGKGTLIFQPGRDPAVKILFQKGEIPNPVQIHAVPHSSSLKKHHHGQM